MTSVIINNMMNVEKKKQTEVERELESTGDTGLDFYSLFKEIFSK